MRHCGWALAMGGSVFAPLAARALGWLRVSGSWRMLLTPLLILLRVGLRGRVGFAGFVRGRAPLLLALCRAVLAGSPALRRPYGGLIAGPAGAAHSTAPLLARVGELGGSRLAVDPRDVMVEQPFDRLDRFDIFRRDQGCGEAFAAGAAGAPDAVDIVLGMDRNVVVEDVADVGDVEPAGGDVARGEKGDRAVAEGVERRRR